MIVITGGTGRLGKELVKLYKADHKTVVNIARSENKDADHNLLYDLQDGEAILSVAKEVDMLAEPAEAIINAAGFYKGQKLGEISESEIKRNMATHVKAPMLLASELFERIKKDGTDVVNISSIAAITPSVGAPAYGASKSALRGFSADLRLALKNYPSRVVTLCPAAFGPAEDGQMDVKDVAKLIKQLLDLPKNIEVSEVIINMKAQYD